MPCVFRPGYWSYLCPNGRGYFNAEFKLQVVQMICVRVFLVLR